MLVKDHQHKIAVLDDILHVTVLDVLHSEHRQLFSTWFTARLNQQKDIDIESNGIDVCVSTATMRVVLVQASKYATDLYDRVYEFCDMSREYLEDEDVIAQDDPKHLDGLRVALDHLEKAEVW